MKTTRQPASDTQRRKAARVRSQLPVVVGDKNGFTHDISATGVLFELDQKHELGSLINFWVELDTPGGKLKLVCEATVARVEESDGKVKIAAHILNQEIKPLNNN
ncbi:PilZ domain-containing protein [Polynucleobacter sp. UB-Tiil-W10]|uniref:PilZ domain-containing protein n=1 Tax=Polynucleobacter sp. UB-Tiil-W10 TaxID=1855648 RepID=UPI001C0E562F|nr:PilZ domain-containing protein [Polynucleobacter sp. UB-Tiil-W10]MBU3541646.1 PilZ domain-containing protein [Polynucleobacter sp. UB-Tiil-W10]